MSLLLLLLLLLPLAPAGPLMFWNENNRSVVLPGLLEETKVSSELSVKQFIILLLLPHVASAHPFLPPMSSSGPRFCSVAPSISPTYWTSITTDALLLSAWPSLTTRSIVI